MGMNIKKIIDGLHFTISMILFNPLTGESKTPDQLNEDDRITYDACTDAIEVLRAQEPRVMTLEEVKQHNNQDGCVWFEQPTYNADAAFVLEEDDLTQVISPYIFGEPINHGYWTNSNYGKTWRCWTSRPDQATMEETPWD